MKIYESSYTIYRWRLFPYKMAAMATGTLGGVRGISPPQ